MVTLDVHLSFPITPDDLTLAQDYLREKTGRLVRYLHGWGVGCGAHVKPASDDKPWRVLIEPGYPLGPVVTKILVERIICFDRRTKVSVRCRPC